MAINHSDITDAELHPKLKSGTIRFGGYIKGKIYGTLTCGTGRRMARTSRIFFRDEAEALNMGYRPCGNCLRVAHAKWKAKQNL